MANDTQDAAPDNSSQDRHFDKMHARDTGQGPECASEQPDGSKPDVYLCTAEDPELGVFNAIFETPPDTEPVQLSGASETPHSDCSAETAVSEPVCGPEPGFQDSITVPDCAGVTYSLLDNAHG